MNPVWAGKVENGKLLLDNVSEFNSYKTSFEGKRIQLILRKYKTQRSIPENNYYWGVIVKILSDFLGYTPEEAHEALKWKFLRKGGKIETVKSTTDLTTTEAEIYYENIRRWALTEYQVKIPLPNEVEL